MPGQDTRTDSDPFLSLRSVLTTLVATWPRRVILAVVLLAPLVLALTGGLNAAPLRQADLIATGQSVDAGIYNLAVESYFVTGTLRGDAPPEGAQAWLGLVFTAVNPHDETVRVNRHVVNPPEELLVDPAEPNPAPNDVFRLDSGERDETLAPALPVRMAAVWPIADAAAVPEQMELVLNGMQREWSDILGTHGWYEQRPVARQVVDRDAVPAALDEDV